MKFKIKCASWKANVDGNMVRYYNHPINNIEEDYETTVEINTIDELKELIEKYKDQWLDFRYTDCSQKPYKKEYYHTSKDVIVNFETMTIILYNDYIE